MKREVRLLKDRGVQSLVLAIELFNRPSDRGRVEAVLIHADHAFEMLLKAVIRHRGGRIRKPREAQTIGFAECVQKCLSDAQVQCLTASQTVALRALNGWRDAAQHYLLELPETELYLAAQGAVTLFDDLLRDVFGESLRDHLPDRVLPVSTDPPRDLDLLLDSEFAFIQTLIDPRTRRLSQAKARLRPIAILEAAAHGEDMQPTEGSLRRAIQRLRAGDDWRVLYRGVAALQLDTSGSGLTYSLRLTKKEGLPVRLEAEGENKGVPVAVRRVNELDFYQFGFTDLAGRLSGLVTRGRLTAVIRHLGLKDAQEFYKEIRIGKSSFGRYSQAALKSLQEELPGLDVEAIWQAEKERRHLPQS